MKFRNTLNTVHIETLNELVTIGRETQFELPFIVNFIHRISCAAFSAQELCLGGECILCTFHSLLARPEELLKQCDSKGHPSSNVISIGGIPKRTNRKIVDERLGSHSRNHITLIKYFRFCLFAIFPLPFASGHIQCSLYYMRHLTDRSMRGYIPFAL